MKKLALLVVCIFLTGCDDVLVTAKLPPIQDDRVVGVWANPQDSSDLGVIEKSGDGYAIQPEEAGGKSTRFTLTRAGDAMFAQIEEKCANHVFSFTGDTRICYRIIRLEIEEDSLAFLQIDVGVFEKLPEINLEYRVATSRPKRGDTVTCALIESPASELVAFLATLPAENYKAGARMRRSK